MKAIESMINSQALHWRCIGPARGGRVVAVAGDYHHPMTFYFGACAGGIWKTTDGGTYWECVSDGFLGSATIGALAVAPSDSNVIYAGTGETTIRIDVSFGDGMYKSTDAGRTWKHIGLKDTKQIGEIRIHPDNPDHLYVAAFGDAFGPSNERGVYRSLDGGDNWERILFQSDEAGAIDISMDPSNPRILFAATWQAHRKFWQLSSGGPGSALFSSMDGGDSWQEVSQCHGFARGTLGKIGVTISPARQGLVYALVEADEENTGLYVSQDYGQSWKLRCPNRDLIHRPWYYTHIFADPVHADTVYVTNYQMWKTTDGGVSFHEITTPHGDNHDLWVDPANPQRMIEGNDGGACVSFNGGDSWTSIYNQNTAQFYRMDIDNQYPYRVYATQQDNTSISVPSQAEWGMITYADSTLPGTGESGFIAVHPHDANIVYIGAVGSSPGGNGALQRYDHRTRQMKLINVWPEESTGFAPRDLKYRFAWTFPIHFSPHDANIIYVGGNHVFRTSDEGMSWDKISPDLSRNDTEKLDFSGGPLTSDSAGAEQYATCSSVVESIHRKGELWAATDDGLVHVSRDGGDKWDNVTPADMPEWAYVGNVEISTHDADTVYLSATRFKLSDYKPYLFKSTDSGNSWQRISDSFPQDEITRVIRADTERAGLLFAGTETGIFVTSNDGDSWKRMGGNLPVSPVYDLKIKQSDLVVATHGRSFWILDDITPLRAPAQKGDGAQLYLPRTTVRQNIHWSAGLFNGDGKDYSPAFGVPGASYMADMPDGTKQRKYLDTGENPPAGAIIYYWLDEKTAGSPVSISIQDAKGVLIATCDGGLEKMPDKRKPGTRAGLNRFVWDLSEDAPVRLDKSLKNQKYEPLAKGGDGPNGVTVKPGQYQVTMTIGKIAQTAVFDVVKDPRIATSDDDFAVQHDLASAIIDKLSELNIAVNRIRLMKQQLENMHKIMPDQTELASDLIDKLADIEGKLVNSKRETPRDVLRHPAGFDDTLENLLWIVNIADTRPPAQAQEVAENVFAKIDSLFKRLDQLVNGEITEFNEKIAHAGPPAVSGNSITAPKTGW
ncbi:MAG: glycosyl hydrolase [Hyphomicrobiales bacterium]|nr:glycosyl hydrolase [Hyphomicrobiales bacterium]